MSRISPPSADGSMPRVPPCLRFDEQAAEHGLGIFPNSRIEQRLGGELMQMRSNVLPALLDAYRGD